MVTPQNSATIPHAAAMLGDIPRMLPATQPKVAPIQNDGTISDYSSGCGHLADKPFVLNNSFGAAATNCSNDNANGIYEKAAGCLTRIIEAGWKMEY